MLNCVTTACETGGLALQSTGARCTEAGQATCMVRARRSCAAEALRVLSARSCCAGANVGTTVAAPSGVGSKSVCVPFFDTRMQRSTCKRCWCTHQQLEAPSSMCRQFARAKSNLPKQCSLQGCLGAQTCIRQPVSTYLSDSFRAVKK